MKLYEVMVEAVAYVWAESQRDAERIVESDISGDVMDGADITVVQEVGPSVPIWAQWVQCNPFGDAPAEFDGLTVGEVKAKMQEKDNDVDRETLALPFPA